MDSLYHHRIKGQKWGVRRYQYADGSLTPMGRRHVNNSDSSMKSGIVNGIKNTISSKINKRLDREEGVDRVLKKGTDLSRIQTSDTFEKHAFYATHLQDDKDKYLGLFGKNLMNRYGKSPVYQLHIESTEKLRMPSDENASDITYKLLKDKDFKSNASYSIGHAKTLMLRPQQQMLFSQAQKAMKASESRDLSRKEKESIYKAFNLSLVNHDSREIKAQNIFYDELKRKGYNAILDHNDKNYSSYHAKAPTIIFDMDSVKLSSVTRANSKVVNSLSTKYNAERIRKETTASTIGLIKQYANTKLDSANSYLELKINKYLKAQ